MTVLTCWRDDKLAAGRTTVLARWHDDKSAAGRTAVLDRWCDGELTAGWTVVLACGRDDVPAEGRAAVLARRRDDELVAGWTMVLALCVTTSWLRGGRRCPATTRLWREGQRFSLAGAMTSRRWQTTVPAHWRDNESAAGQTWCSLAGATTRRWQGGGGCLPAGATMGRRRIGRRCLDIVGHPLLAGMTTSWWQVG